MKRILGNSTLHWIFGIAVIILAGLLMFTPNIAFLRRMSNYTVYFMLAYLAMAMFFFVLDQKKLMLFSFLGCCLLCFYLKGNANQNMRLSQETSLPKMAISMINLSLVEDSPFQAVGRMKASSSDVIVVQELTPDWNEFLRKDSNFIQFPYRHMMVRIDQYGMGILSKYPISLVDTFYYGQIPNLFVAFNWNEDENINLVSSITVPPVSFAAFENIEAHFAEITRYIDKLNGPVVTLGNYNRAPWTEEVRKFKYQAKLNDSRRDATTRYSDGSVSVSLQALDHIFYNDELACIGFNEISNSNFSHLGILGTYQLKSILENKNEPLID